VYTETKKSKTNNSTKFTKKQCSNLNIKTMRIYTTHRSHQLPEPQSAAAPTTKTKKTAAAMAAPAAETKAAAAGPTNSSKPTLRK
jgi:hypothetical protein